MDIHHSDVSYPPNNILAEALDDPVGDGNSDTNGAEPVHDQSEVNLNNVLHMLGEDLTPYERTAGQGTSVLCWLSRF